MVGIVPGASSARHLIHLVRLRRRSRRRLLLGHLHAGHVLHLLALLTAGNRTALVPLLLLFGGLCEDLATFLCKTIDTQGVTKRPHRKLPAPMDLPGYQLSAAVEERLRSLLRGPKRLTE